MAAYTRLAAAIAARRDDECIYALDVCYDRKQFFSMTKEQFVGNCNAHFRTRDTPLLLYECITHACLFFVDLDDAAGSDLDDTLRWIRTFISDGVRIYHSPPKASFHIRGAVGSRVYASIHELRETILAAEPPPPSVDLSVYTRNRLLRCVGSTKWNQGRPLLAWPDGALSDGITVEDLVAIPAPGDVKPPPFRARHINGGVPEPAGGVPTKVRSAQLDPRRQPTAGLEALERYGIYHDRTQVSGDITTVYVQSKDCKIAGRVHRSNRIYFEIQRDGTILQRCFKCAGAVVESIRTEDAT